MRRAVTASLALALLAPAAAHAAGTAEVGTTTGYAEFTAAPGIENDLLVVRRPTADPSVWEIVFDDGGESGGDEITPGRGCFATTPVSVTCTVDDLAGALVRTRDGNDRVRLDGDFNASDTAGGEGEVYGGTGNDVILGSAGRDVIDGGPGDDELAGGFGDDVFRVLKGRDRVGAGPDQDEIETASRLRSRIECHDGIDLVRIRAFGRVPRGARGPSISRTCEDGVALTRSGDGAGFDESPFSLHPRRRHDGRLTFQLPCSRRGCDPTLSITRPASPFATLAAVTFHTRTRFQPVRVRVQLPPGVTARARRHDVQLRGRLDNAFPAPLLWRFKVRLP